MTNIIYKNSRLSLNGQDTKKQLAETLLKKGLKEIREEEASLKKEIQELHSNPAEETQWVTFNRNKKIQDSFNSDKKMLPSVSLHDDIWEKSIQILSSYIAGSLPSKDVKTIMKAHLEIIEFLFVSKEFLSDKDQKQKIIEKKYNALSIPIEESVYDDYLICLEDGQKKKFLAPYLLKKYNLSKEQYIKKWKLPNNYPFTAPKISRQRRACITKTRAWKYNKG